MSPPRYRSLLDLAMNRTSYTCNSCTRTLLRQRTFFRPQQQQTRLVQTSQRSRQHAAPNMNDMRKSFDKRNENTIYYTLSVILGTVALSYGSVPLYKTLCQETGWGGTPTKSSVHTSPSGEEDIAAKLTPITSSRRLRITFQGSTSDVLPWKFTPQQREVRVLPGETALAFYTATNKSDEDVIGVATYSVTPGQVAPYFSKIQCFCFEEQRLNKGETVDMPVFFYIDPEFLKDPAMKGIDTITLNYTFFSKLLDPLQCCENAGIIQWLKQFLIAMQKRSTTRMVICRQSLEREQFRN
jgi:cytochrome c oxidase assembly protein subunit 11